MGRWGYYDERPYDIWAAKCLSHCKGKEKAHEVHLDDDDDTHLPVNDDSEDDSKESSMGEEVANLERYVL